MLEIWSRCFFLFFFSLRFTCVGWGLSKNQRFDSNFVVLLNFSKLLNSLALHQDCERCAFFFSCTPPTPLPTPLPPLCHSFHPFVSKLARALWTLFNALLLSAFVFCSFYHLPISHFLLLSTISLNQGDMTSTALLW